MKEAVCSINSVKKVLTIIFEFNSLERNTDDFNQDVDRPDFFLTETVPTLPFNCFTEF